MCNVQKAMYKLKSYTDSCSRNVPDMLQLVLLWLCVKSWTKIPELGQYLMWIYYFIQVTAYISNIQGTMHEWYMFLKNIIASSNMWISRAIAKGACRSADDLSSPLNIILTSQVSLPMQLILSIKPEIYWQTGTEVGSRDTWVHNAALIST